MRRALLPLLVLTALLVSPAAVPAGEPVTVTGRVVSVAVDAVDPVTGKMKADLHTWLRDASGAHYRLETPGGPPAHGRVVTVEGSLEGGRIEAWRVSAAPAALATPLSLPADPQRTLVVLADFPDFAGGAFDAADARAAVFTGADASDAFLRENSGGVEKLTGDPATSVVGWRTLPRLTTGYTSVWDLARGVIAALDAEVLFTDVGRLVLIFPGGLPFTGNALGNGTLGTTIFESADGPFTASAVWLWGTTDPMVISHELGHNLGYMHASSILCPVSATNDGLPESLIEPQSSCVVPNMYEEYGDPHDTMGNSWQYDHFGVRRKILSGWVPPAQVVDASAGGTFTLEQVELPSAGAKALGVALGTDHQGRAVRYWLEYRAGLGFDGTAGVQVRAQTPTYVARDLLSPGKWTGNFLRYTTDGESWSGAGVGSPFADTHRGVKIEVLGTSGAGAASQAQVKVSVSGLRIEPEGVLGWGNVLVGQGVVRPITVRNTGAGAVTLGTLLATGRQRSDLSLTNDACSGQTVAAGGSCTVDLVVDPDAEGERFAIVRIPSDDPLRPKATLATYGVGIRSSIPVLTPASVDFGGVGLGSVGAPHTVVVSNEGNVDMPTQIGWDQEFPVTSNTCTAPVPPGGSCSFDIAYAPVYQAGVVAKTLEIVTNSRVKYSTRLGLVAEALMVDHHVTVVNETPALGRVYSIDPVTFLADGKIDCGLGGTACAADYPYAYGAFSIRLRSEPVDWDHEFDAWGGDYPSYLQELGLHSTRDYALTARFRERRVWGQMDGQLSGVCHGTLTVDSAGSRATCPWDGTQTGWPPFGFNCRVWPWVGYEATFTAVAEPGCDATVQIGELCTGNPCTVTVADFMPTFAVNFFPVGPLPMKVTAPAAKSAVPSGGYATIAWESPRVAQYFTIDLSLNGGKTWTTIGEDLEIFDETWVRWWVPVVPANVTQAKVRVTGATYNGVKGVAASKLFTIEVVKLLAPNGGETLAAGEVVPVSWRVAKTQTPVASIGLYLSTDAAYATWRPIAPLLTRKARSFSWTVPAWAAANPALPRKMKVVLKNAAGKIVGSDLSDKSFLIRP